MPSSSSPLKIPLAFQPYCNLDDIAEFILSCQASNGAIYWFKGHKLDPWDHTEAAMALSITGNHHAAEKAYCWLNENQNGDGSWFARYDQNTLEAGSDHWKIETNFVAYPATGIWQHYLITGDLDFLSQYFPMIEKSMNYVLSQQGQDGEIQWATSAKELLPKDALITACASILRSLECAIHIAGQINKNTDHWRTAYIALADALTNKPWRFDRTWESKSRYSMDWFYPILAGIYTEEEAQTRLQKYWSKFVEQDLGCRCVADQPWVTTAESCELIMALVAANKTSTALELFKWLAQWRDKNAGYWTGYNFRDKVIWPQEKTSWTAAAIVLAADALFKLTPAAQLFTSKNKIL